MAHTGHILVSLANGTARCSLTLENIVFRMRKDYLRIILFLMAKEDLCFKKQLTSMQDLKNSNWIILD